MNRIKRIAVGVDFSVYSPRVLKYAAESAERMSAEIIAVNVFNQRRMKEAIGMIHDEETCRKIMDTYVNDEMEKRNIKMNALINSSMPKEVSYRTIIRTGMPFEEILKVIDDEDANLLIISSRGRTDFQDYMFGTTAEKLFRHAPVSVLSLNLIDELF